MNQFMIIISLMMTKLQKPCLKNQVHINHHEFYVYNIDIQYFIKRVEYPLQYFSNELQYADILCQFAQHYQLCSYLLPKELQ